MSDLVQRLRDRAFSGKSGDPLCAEAADEIERLRADVATSEVQSEIDYQAEIERLRLTDAEREAVKFFSQIDGPGNVPVANKRAATLRGLLERLK